MYCFSSLRYDATGDLPGLIAHAQPNGPFNRFEIGHFALQYTNNHSLYASYINQILNKAVYVNILNRAEARSSIYNASSQQFLQGVFT